MNTSQTTIIYDGQCELCQWSRRWLEKLNRQNQLTFIDLHDDAAMAQFPQIRREEALAQMIAITPDGQISHGYDGLVLLLDATPSTKWLRHILRRRPIRWLGRKIYGIIARNRYRLRWLPTCGSSCAIKHE